MAKVDVSKMLTIDNTGMPKAPNLTQLLDKDVRALYIRDDSFNKERYIAEVGVIYYLGDPKSPVRQKGLSNEECLKEAIENFNLPENYQPDDLVNRLIVKYYNQAITPAGVILENLNKAIHNSDLIVNKISDILNSKLRNLINDDDIGAIIGQINQIAAIAKSMPDLSKAVATAYENLRNEEETQMARGGVTILSSMDADDSE